MAAASAATPRAPRTATLFPVDMYNTKEYMDWMRDNNVNSVKLVATDLQQYSSLAAGSTFASAVMPANLVAQVGEGFEFLAWGRTAATANNKTIGLSFGGNALIGSGALAANNKPWMVRGVIFLTAGQAWEFWADGFASDAIIVPTEGQVTVDPTAAITILTTCTAATADADCLQKGLLVKHFDQLNFTTYR